MDIVSFLEWVKEQDTQEKQMKVENAILNQVSSQGDGKQLKKTLAPYQRVRPVDIDNIESF